MSQGYGQLDAKKLKISIIGDMGAGKTCLSLRFVKNLFTEEHKATISDIETKGVDIRGNYVVFQIWDTAGQERFRSLLPLYMKGIDGAIVVYDVTDRVTFNHVPQWVMEVRKYAQNNTVLMVVGNKIDLAQEYAENKQISTEDGQSWCRIHDILFYEASAKSGENVNNLFLDLGEAILQRMREQREQPCRYVYNDSCTDNDAVKSRKKCCVA